MKKSHVLTACALVAASGAWRAAIADNINGPVIKPYTPGSTGIALGPCRNKTGAPIYDFRLNINAPAAEPAAFQIDAADSDVEPDPNPMGDGAGPPDFDPMPAANGRTVRLVADATNGEQSDPIRKDPGENNPFHVVVDFTQAAMMGGSVTITPTDQEGHDLVAKDTTGNVSRESYSVNLGLGGQYMTTQVTYTGKDPIDQIAISVPGTMRIVRADVDPPFPPPDESLYCASPTPCWNDHVDGPNFDPVGTIPPGGVSTVVLRAVNPGHVILPGTEFRIQFQIAETVPDDTTQAIITIGAAAGIPAMSPWSIGALSLLLAGAGVVVMRRWTGGV